MYPDGLCSNIHRVVLIKIFVDQNMGKFLSKHVSNRRQNPEGGSLSSSVLTCEREMEHSINKTKLTENLYVEVKKIKSEHNSNFKVVLPPQKSPETFQLRDKTKKRSIYTKGTLYGKVHQPGQEWVFTLYNFDTTGKVTKEDMSSLILSMYEVLEAAVKQPYGRTTPLKIKLVVTPSPCSVEKEQSISQERGQPVRLYCVGENIERRNHYLDLAGIENYSSKFDNTDLSFQGLQEVSSALQHHPVAISEDYMHTESLQQFFKNKAMSFKKERSRGDEKTCRLHGQHPASWCNPTKPHVQRSCRRLYSRVQDSASPLKHPAFHVQPGRDCQISNCLPTCEVTLAQRHDHHHHHEHHHHHHYHHS
ncbi:naked cuticle-like protein 3 isoform X2 [Melanotaenia boesemani]|uniref:naked cuticle-like protein 3 isoform X2 n=1 Tax=Melanotaenia boesemani TaxID=1250792 RepID=UPI001C05C9C0|nr:naked cuticle-like protein 3 isoform X2 [Melanotaenia boesemani]